MYLVMVNDSTRWSYEILHRFSYLVVPPPQSSSFTPYPPPPLGGKLKSIDNFMTRNRGQDFSI
jgi:hypothetical protein